MNSPPSRDTEIKVNVFDDLGERRNQRLAELTDHLLAYADEGPSLHTHNFEDLLTDLLHLAGRHGFDFVPLRAREFCGQEVLDGIHGFVSLDELTDDAEHLALAASSPARPVDPSDITAFAEPLRRANLLAHTEPARSHQVATAVAGLVRGGRILLATDGTSLFVWHL